MFSRVASDYRTSIEVVFSKIAAINPKEYERTRNYLQGSVTWLSPYITHGIVSTTDIARTVLACHKPESCERLLFELGWREYFHRTWQLHGKQIFSDMRHEQQGAKYTHPPQVITQGQTGIHVLDRSLRHLLCEGLMHNHARLWVAGITCNLCQTHWYEPARWLHYHLLDGDLASNSLSWQWVAGTFSHKKYIANQANINKYSQDEQIGTWLDKSYDDLAVVSAPDSYQNRCELRYTGIPSGIPRISEVNLADIPEIALRSIWQLNPAWQTHLAKQIVFVDQGWHRQWPISEKRWRFIQHWAEVCRAQLVVGTVDQLKQSLRHVKVAREEYPACQDWPGRVIERSWLYPLPERSFTSFSQYFKQVKHHAGL